MFEQSDKKAASIFLLGEDRGTYCILKQAIV